MDVETEPPRERKDSCHARQGGTELGERRSGFGAGRAEQVRERDLPVRWIDVQPLVVGRADVADSLLEPQRSAREVVVQLIPAIGRRAEDQSECVCKRNRQDSAQYQHCARIQEDPDRRKFRGRSQLSAGEKLDPQSCGEKCERSDQKRRSCQLRESGEKKDEPDDLGERDHIDGDDELREAADSDERRQHESTADRTEREYPSPRFEHVRSVSSPAEHSGRLVFQSGTLMMPPADPVCGGV